MSISKRYLVLAPYQSTLAELSKFDLEAAHGAQLRSQIRWVEEGEQSSAYFFQLEKKGAADRHTSELRESDGTIVSNIAGLCDSISSFYSGLFASEPTDVAARESQLSNICSTLSNPLFMMDFFLLVNVVLPFWVWPNVRHLARMACLWNFM